MYAQGQYAYQIGVSELESLFNYLAKMGYLNIGSIYRDGAIMLDRMCDFSDLASGFQEHVGKGQYQLHNDQSTSLFQYSVGPQSFKKYLHPERRLLWSADKTEDGFSMNESKSPDKMAFWGMRNCDLMAMKILDQVFINDQFPNTYYDEVRKDTFIIAAGCTVPSDNCFCTTQGSGPEPLDNFDFSLIELLSDKHNLYLVSVGSDRAEKVAEDLNFEKASQQNIDVGIALLKKSSEQMQVRFNAKKVSKILKENPNHKHWENVANRCLSCANCTMVCPTCFCTSTEDITDITGDHTERWLRWDSCFNGDFSFIHGGKIRSSTKSRYRQWLSHKLSNWYDQFGSSGCVGCGRCTTWCPVGIDLTEEVKELTH